VNSNYQIKQNATLNQNILELNTPRQTDLRGCGAAAAGLCLWPVLLVLA
jgi:hypothetical protein